MLKMTSTQTAWIKSDVPCLEKVGLVSDRFPSSACAYCGSKKPDRKV